METIKIMETYKIENVAMPDETRGRKKSKIRATLEATPQGKSFLIPSEDLDVESARQQVYRCANAMNINVKKSDRFNVKTFLEKEGLRVFKIDK